MANQFFDNYRNMMLGGGDPSGFVDWAVDTIKASLIDVSVEPVPYLQMATRDELTALGVVSEITLTGVTIGTIAAGTIDCDNDIFPAVSGENVAWIVIWKDTGDPATSPLLYLIDTFSVGTPVPSTGEDVPWRIHDNGLLTVGG